MTYPSLVREQSCRTDITITLYSQEMGEDGEQIAIFNDTLKCNYQGSGHSKQKEGKNTIELKGVALLNGDPFNSIEEITGGKVEVLGNSRNIYKGYKERNPDGTVNYIRLELI